MKRLCCNPSLVLALGLVSQSFAAGHLVPATEFHAALTSQSNQRDANLAEIRTLLSDEAVRERLSGIARLDKIEASIANLDDETLRELGDQARKLNGDVTAGANQTVVILIVAAIIVGSVLLNLIPSE